MAQTRREVLEKTIYDGVMRTIANKASSAEYEIMVHYHDFKTPLPITHYVTSVSKQSTTDYPYEQLSITLSLSHDVAHQLFSDYSGRPTTGQWISIKRPNKIFEKQGLYNGELNSSIDFIGYVTNISFSMEVNQTNALVDTSAIVITCSSFIYPLQVAQYKLNAGDIEDEGIKDIFNAGAETVARKDNPDFQTNTSTKSFFIAGTDYDKLTDEIDKVALEAQSVKNTMKLFVDNLGYTRIPRSLVGEFNTASFIGKYGTVSSYNSEELKVNTTINTDANVVEESPKPILHDGSDDLRIGNFIQVATAEHHLPPSCHLRHSMPQSDPVINNLNAIQNTFARGGSVWDLLKNTYQSSEMLIDFYFTWVPFNKKDLKAGYKLPHEACLHWGAIPFIIYRVKTMNPGLSPTKEGINREISIYEKMLKPTYSFKKLEYDTEIQKSPSVYLASAIYSGEYTALIPDRLRPYLTLGFPLSSNNIINMTYNLSDAYRINSTYVEDPLVQQITQVTAGAFSTPVIDAEDAQNHGLRMIEAPYPFTSLDKPSCGPLAERLYLAQGQGNRFYGGQITLPYPQTKEINPGVWLSIFFPNRSSSPFDKPTDVKRERIFYCYVKSISHKLSINPTNGMVEEVTQIIYTRGSWGNVAPILPPTQSGKIKIDKPTGD